MTNDNKKSIKIKKKTDANNTVGKAKKITRIGNAQKVKGNRMSRRNFLIGGALAFLGIVLVSYQPIINHVIGPYQLEKVYANNISAEEMKDNIERYESADSGTSDELFDYESVKLLTTLDINPSIQTENVIGGIYVPDVDMVMPIMYGVSQDILKNSAGTMKPDQRMGFGNYSLIGHNSKNPNVLFAPIHRIEEGDKMYLTNKHGVYEYEMVSKKVVDPSQIEVIDDVEGKNLLTLISCTPDGKERVIVQGELVTTHMYEYAPKDVLEAFNDL